MNFSRRISFPVFGLCLAWLVPHSATAMPIDKGLIVNVYRLCDDAGSNCASLGPTNDLYFSSAVNKIWAQAGISVSFNFISNINSTAFSAIDDRNVGDRFQDLANAYGAPGYFSSTTVDMFLVHTVAGVYGEGWFGYGGLVIAMQTVMSYNGGAGRIDTIAHELGHNLGLVPDSMGGSQGHSSTANQLMAAGGARSVPTSLGNIAPDGFGYSYLPSDQIALARSSSLLYDIVAAPEPASAALIGLGLVLVGMIRRRKR